jgi:hypothetical protein
MAKAASKTATSRKWLSLNLLTPRRPISKARNKSQNFGCAGRRLALFLQPPLLLVSLSSHGSLLVFDEAEASIALMVMLEQPMADCTLRRPSEVRDEQAGS